MAHDDADCGLLLSTVREKFFADFDISEHIFLVDAHLAMSPELKSLRTHLSEVKQSIVQVRISSNCYSSPETLIPDYIHPESDASDSQNNLENIVLFLCIYVKKYSLAIVLLLCM